MNQTADRTFLLRVIAAFVALYVIWGSTYLAIRVTLDSMSSRLKIFGSRCDRWSRRQDADEGARNFRRHHVRFSELWTGRHALKVGQSHN
jgi:hypothetical protein